MKTINLKKCWVQGCTAKLPCKKHSTEAPAETKPAIKPFVDKITQIREAEMRKRKK